ncbi:hypothetical protein P171DRAFT_442522 [Karstenula rhodostoma CBS 690.94]|uniref:Uncharacterized protein n=1 Tax=Karstenula rhodostoma CBS 690.94 TaxID=1392251 RepID=A0A9P4PNC4_9PLEO|nr:hypothetical protein P171DRAFT_442522 [Karstenula rhodostoma CBS 690.94]
MASTIESTSLGTKSSAPTFLDITRRHASTNRTVYDYDSLASFAPMVVPYFVQDTFYALWAPLRTAINIPEIWHKGNLPNLPDDDKFGVLTILHNTPENRHPLDLLVDLPTVENNTSRATVWVAVKSTRLASHIPAPELVPLAQELFLRKKSSNAKATGLQGQDLHPHKRAWTGLRQGSNATLYGCDLPCLADPAFSASDIEFSRSSKTVANVLYRNQAPGTQLQKFLPISLSLSGSAASPTYTRSLIHNALDPCSANPTPCL